MHSFDNNVYREAFFLKVRLWFSIETPIRKAQSNISIRDVRNKKGTGAEINGVLQVFANVNSTQFPSRFKVANGK